MFHIGSDKILAKNCHVKGRVTLMHKSCLYVVKKPVRLVPNDSNTLYSHWIRFTYTVDNIPYTGKLFIPCQYRSPQKGEIIDVYYDPEKPENYACYAFGPLDRPIGWETMLKYKCLVLDHDDTVVQTEKTIGYPYFRDYVERIRPGMTLSFAEYVHDCNNMVFADMCRARWNMTEEELTEEYLGWKDYSRKNIPEVCPGIGDVIRRQKEMGGLVCVSSLSTSEIIERDFLHHFGCLPDAIYDYDLPVHQRKPNTYALTDLLERFQLKPQDILMVDDMKLGWQMAKAVGADTAFAGWSKTDFPALMEEMQGICDYSFHCAKDLEKFLFGV